MKNKGEVSYYPEIMEFVKNQIESNFYASQKPLRVYCKTGELRKGLLEIIREHNITTSSILEFAALTPPLSLDIFALITDGITYELLIVEVKLRETVGLAELSQLIGYCIVSNAQYGLLINVNGDLSSRLTDLLIGNHDVSCIKRLLNNQQENKEIIHNLGVMEWDSVTKNLLYSGHGKIRSMSMLCDRLIKRFR